MDIKSLSPGYSVQGASYLRSSLYQGATWVSRKNVFLGKLACIPIYLLSKTTEYLEIPIRLIEDLALTAINLVGATFSKGCRRNLSNCKAILWNDLKDTAITAVLIIGFFGVITYHLQWAIMSPFLANETPQKLADYHRIDFHRQPTIRKHGYNNVRRLENALGISKEIVKKRQPEIAIKVYKQLKKVPKDEFETYYIWITTLFETTGGIATPWQCPDDLKNNPPPAAPEIIRILTLSYQIDRSNMDESQLKKHFCNLLGIPTSSTEAEMKKKYKALARSVHSDRNGSDYAKQAFQIVSDVYDLSGLKNSVG